MFDSTHRIFGLDLMRAIAITLVLFGHCVWIFPLTDGIFHQLMVLSGFLGVEVFFVLSGFLIGKIIYQLYIKKDFRLHSVFYFLKRRWFRTLPNYFLILTVNIAIGYAFHYDLSYVWKYYFFIQNAVTPMTPFFTESWSLSVEEYAYIVLPFTLLALGSVAKPRNKARFFLYSVILLIIVFFLNKIYYQSTTTNVNLNQWNMSLKAVVLYRLDSIFIGVLCSWLYYNFTALWQKCRYLFFVIGIFLFLFQFVAIGYFKLFIETHPVFWNVLYLPLVSVMVACFLPFLSEWKSEASGIRKPIVWISVLSYSIYLLHYGVILHVMKNYIRYDASNPLELYPFLITYIALTLLLSYLLYRFYEKPLMDLRDKS